MASRRTTTLGTELIRAAAILVVALVTLGWMGYMAHAVPLKVHYLPAKLVPAMTVIALAALIVMLAVDAVIVIVVWGHGRRQRQERARVIEPQPHQKTDFLPRQVDLRTMAATALASIVVFFGLAAVGLPLWFMGGAALLPWLPLYVSAATWQYTHFGALALFGTVVLLQLGHLSEHVVQNVQLLVTHGQLAASRGVFGQLDVETVHFYWNIGIWLGTGALLYRYGFSNIWLTVAFFAAGLHSVEHLYMYWLYVTHSAAYLAGGWNGILGQGGLLGLPLARPYLHLVYNVVEITPLVVAYQQRLNDVFAVRAMPQAMRAAPEPAG